jgi:group II intron reverse transcriptase/maturase
MFPAQQRRHVTMTLGLGDSLRLLAALLDYLFFDLAYRQQDHTLKILNYHSAVLKMRFAGEYLRRVPVGFRPHRNAHQAVAVARSIVASGRQWAVIADIRKCFDNIDHDVLLSALGLRIADEEFLTLVRNWLTVDIFELGEMFPNEIGVPQGESLSPLLANIYLDALDRHFEMLGIPFVRYADDFVMFAHSKDAAEDICRRLADFLHDVLRLELKPAKTFYVHVAEGYDFLGFHIANSSIIVQPARIEALLLHLSILIKELAASASSFDKVAQCLTRFNSIARGWRNYFLLPGEPSLSTQMRELDDRIEQIASIHLPDSLRQNPAWLRDSLWGGLARNLESWS